MPARKDRTPEKPGTIITTRLIEDRKRARAIEHLMDHQPPYATCEGCQARARQKKHHKGSYDASEKDRSMIITMYQVNIQDFDYTAGYGGFRYGIVICSLKTKYFVFIPLRTMQCNDAQAAFIQFRLVHKLKKRMSLFIVTRINLFDRYAIWMASRSSTRRQDVLKPMP